MIKIGSIVKFPYGKIPKNSGDIGIAATRASNMAEHRLLEAAKAKIEYIQTYATGQVTNLIDDKAMIDDDYLCLIKDLEILKHTLVNEDI